LPVLLKKELHKV